MKIDGCMILVAQIAERCSHTLIVKREFSTSMWCNDNIRRSRPCGQVQHLQTLLNRTCSIVEAGEYMAVNINHVWGVRCDRQSKNSALELDDSSGSAIPGKSITALRPSGCTFDLNLADNGQ